MRARVASPQRMPRAGVLELFGIAMKLAIGDPVGAPAREIFWARVVHVGAIFSQQTEADAVEFVRGVDRRAPHTEAARFGGLKDQTEGGMMTGDEVALYPTRHPHQRLPVKGIAAV